MKKKSTRQAINYWLSVVAIGLLIGFGIREVRAWVNPLQTPPSGNVQGPITTGTDQIKTGSLGIGGSVSIDGGLRMKGASFGNCDLKTNANGTVTCGTDAIGGASLSVPNCSTGQVLKGDGSTLSCVTDATVVVPTCSTGQVVTGNGATLSCVTDTTGGMPTPPVCTGTKNALQWSGTAWNCVEVSTISPGNVVVVEQRGQASASAGSATRTVTASCPNGKSLLKGRALSGLDGGTLCERCSQTSTTTSYSITCSSMGRTGCNMQSIVACG